MLQTKPLKLIFDIKRNLLDYFLIKGTDANTFWGMVVVLHRGNFNSP